MDLDVTSLLEAALQQGIWAALYIYLFFRMLKENASREERYQWVAPREDEPVARAFNAGGCAGVCLLSGKNVGQTSAETGGRGDACAASAFYRYAGGGRRFFGGWPSCGGIGRSLERGRAAQAGWADSVLSGYSRSNGI